MPNFSHIKNEIFEEFLEEYIESIEDLSGEKNERLRDSMLRHIIRDAIEFTLSHPAARDIV